MTTGKAGTEAPEPSPECCMCGDYGLSYELFKCTVCQFRSQHRYCSNMYPKSESYRVCNWCLNQRDEKTQNLNSSNSSSSSSYRNKSEDDRLIRLIKSRKKNGGSTDNHRGGLKGHKDSGIKKPRSGSPPSGRKRMAVVNGGGGGGVVAEERLRRTKSEEISNGNGNGMTTTTTTTTKHVLRNKVRRYKLLDEVSSQ